jgi:type IV pilus assembly protein PilX
MKQQMRQRPDQQRGISLIVVMVMLLLASVVVLSSTRIGWFNEKFVGSQSDYQRAFAAAEALMKDAEHDIRGINPDGTPCKTAANHVGCRSIAQPYFPQDDDDIDTVTDRVGNNTSCKQGICIPSAVTTFGTTTWTTDLSAMTATAVAATYGQFTGVDPQSTGNPLLMSATPRAWYWVEVFRYSNAGAITNQAGDLPIPDKNHPFVYRITTYATGLKPGTRVWLRSVFIPRPQNQNG